MRPARLFNFSHALNFWLRTPKRHGDLRVSDSRFTFLSVPKVTHKVKMCKRIFLQVEEEKCVPAQRELSIVQGGLNLLS